MMSTVIISNVQMIEINELLAYVQFYRDRSPVEAIHKIVVGFFMFRKFQTKKRMPISLFVTDLTSCPFKLARRPPSSRPAHDAEVDDIIHIRVMIIEQLENQNDLQKVRSAASNFARIPKYGPEEVNVYMCTC